MTDSEPETAERTDPEEERVPDIPADAVDEVERLTRLARAAERREDDAAVEEASVYRERREELVEEYDYETRLRDEDDTLVLYPEEWLVDGVVQLDRVEETDRAVEISLSGPGDPERWQEIADHNDDLVDAVAEEHPDHEANARALADFASNHYAKPVEKLTVEEVEVFLDEYYPRNTWPSEADASLIETSVRKLFAAADSEPPAPVEN
ncbi:hypothetical protein B4589_013680 [Halolamina sp. CBA1230]|uniref:DUF7108 family protein n=1 Tax=Halolamina sp. CBA1230 TaxID=1853690 RepID=UPI0009A19506|nr:hypothetical protein [Halolamina sp. CBA1230]QKY21371.1 hypothetical protein B4589_013680 [Halolamina sp. CBA1230]